MERESKIKKRQEDRGIERGEKGSEKEICEEERNKESERDKMK